MDLHNIRQEYAQQELNGALASPFEQFQIWLQQAIDGKVNEPTAMNIATVSEEGKPSSRWVLLKEFNQQGFIFFTNYHSRKGKEIAHNPNAALGFFWPELERQVRIEGVLEFVDEAQSDHYFASRPYTSRVGAWASHQSDILESKASLLARAAAIAAKHPLNIPRPPHWGGYLLRPNRMEFWQGRPSRLHDRIVYQKQSDGAWQQARLSP